MWTISIFSGWLCLLWSVSSLWLSTVVSYMYPRHPCCPHYTDSVTVGAAATTAARRSSTSILWGVSRKHRKSIERELPNRRVISKHASPTVADDLNDMEKHMAHVSSSVNRAVPRIVRGLEESGFVIMDNLLGTATCAAYRKEAEGIFERGEMAVSQSTFWDNNTRTVVTFEKTNVLSTQLLGGTMYEKSPRLHEYVVALTRALVPSIIERFPESKLSLNLASNKLAVCLGDGSRYDKHYDNSGSADLRKLTVILYLNPHWRNDLGGCYRLFVPSGSYSESSMNAMDEAINGISAPLVDSEGFLYRDIAPLNDRLMIFWSDKIVHSVLASHVLDSPRDNRYAFTVWLAATDSSAIAQDDEEVRRHFGNSQERVFVP